MLTRVCLCRRLQGHEGSQPAQADDPQGQKKRLSSAGEEDSSAGEWSDDELGSSNAAHNESEEGAHSPRHERRHQSLAAKTNSIDPSTVEGSEVADVML